MRFIVVRHGRPEWQSHLLISLAQFERIAPRYDDAPLSQRGLEAVSSLADQLPKVPILSSDLPRARGTAEAIGNGNHPIEFDPLFREVPNARIGKSLQGLLGKLWAPADIWAFVSRCCWIFGIGKCPEKPAAAWERVSKATDEILKHFERTKDLILVSHGWFLTILALHLRWRGLIRRGPLLPLVGYGAMTEYILNPKANV